MNRSDGAAALAVVAVALTLYTATLAPGLLWGGGDFARFQTWAYLGGIEGPVDLFAHPLWVYLAHPFTWLPVRDPAWRANFASAVFASAALGFVFQICRLATRSIAPALLATGALAVSHTFWTYAVMPKVYSLNALLLSACLYFLLRWRERRETASLALASFLYGLGFLNHVVMATAAAGLAAFVVLAAREAGGRNVRRAATVCGLSFAAGVTPFAILILQAGSGSAIAATALRFLGGLTYAFTHPAELAEGVGWAVVLAVYQFPLTAPFAVAGFVSLCRRDPPLAACVGLIAGATIAFLLGALDPTTGGAYVWNLHYYLQAYVAFAPALACGFLRLQQGWIARRPLRAAAAAFASLAVPPLLYATAPSFARRVALDVPDFRPLPGRDNFAYALTPWKHHETAPRAYAEAMFAAVGRGGVLFADYGPWAMLHYLQEVEHARPDVELVLLRGKRTQVAQILSRRTRQGMFLADTYRYYDLPGIEAHFELIPAGPIFRLKAKYSVSQLQ